MRDILFRGKRTDNGEWVYGSYVEAKNSWHKFGVHPYWIIPMAFANGGWFAVAQRFPVVGDSVGQYTGMIDSCGLTKIFEGDIIDPTGRKVGNAYEDECLLEGTANCIVERMGTEAWSSSEQEAIKRGCRYAK